MNAEEFLKEWSVFKPMALTDKVRPIYTWKDMLTFSKEYARLYAEYKLSQKEGVVNKSCPHNEPCADGIRWNLSKCKCHEEMVR